MGGDGWDGSDTTGLSAQFDDCYFTNHYSSEDTAPAVQNFVQKYTGKVRHRKPKRLRSPVL